MFLDKNSEQAPQYNEFNGIINTSIQFSDNSPHNHIENIKFNVNTGPLKELHAKIYLSK